MRVPVIPYLGAVLGIALCGMPSLAAAACSTAGLDLPAGFCATRFAQLDAGPRHLAVAANGTVYANLSQPIDGHWIAALVDTNGDGKADRQTVFGTGGETGLLIHAGWLYSASADAVVRYPLAQTAQPNGSGQVIVDDLPEQSEHGAHGLAIDDQGSLYVSIGAPSNSCQDEDRTPGSAGQDPCPLLGEHGGIWRFSADKADQEFAADKRYATGVRNMFALAYDAPEHQLFGVQMGRDQLHSNWPQYFSAEQSANLPAETLFAINQGDNFGWPFCYYDPIQKKNLLNPEYGGNGRIVGQCAGYEQPAAAYPAHWAPTAMVFYHANQFPAQYRGGAFIAFHGSWNRAPAPQEGFRVIFQPFDGATATSNASDFAGPQGFTGQAVVRSPGAAAHRPAGLAVGPRGALYIADDQGGTIYRVTYGPG